MQGISVGDEGASLIPTITWHRCGGISPQVWSYSPVPRVGQRRQQMTPRQRCIGETVETQRERSFPHLKVREVNAVSRDALQRKRHEITLSTATEHSTEGLRTITDAPSPS